MRFFQFICRNVMRRKFRSLLTGIGVAVAIMAVVGLLGVSSGLEQSSREMLSTRGVDLVVVRAGLGERATSRLDENIGEQIAQIPGVEKVAPLLNDTVKLGDDPIGTPVQGYLADSFTLQDLKVDPKSGGRTLTAQDTDGVLLGKFLAESLKKKPGDTVEIESKKFKVLGIFEGRSLFENRAAVALLPVLQEPELMDRQNQVSEFDVKLKPEIAGNEAALKDVQTKIEALAGLTAAEAKALATAQDVQTKIEALAALTADEAKAVAALKDVQTKIAAPAALAAEDAKAVAAAQDVQTKIAAMTKFTADEAKAVAALKNVQTNVAALAALLADEAKAVAGAKDVRTKTAALAALTADEAKAVAALRDVQTKIAALAGPYHLEPLTTDQYVSSSNEIRLSRAMAWMTSIIALVIGAVGMLNTMIMSVLERTQEIGILRAIGWRKRRIMRMILGESFALSAGRGRGGHRWGPSA